MTNDEFKYWINGYLTLAKEDKLSKQQIKIIINHANLVKSISGDLDTEVEEFVRFLEDKIGADSELGIAEALNSCDLPFTVKLL